MTDKEYSFLLEQAIKDAKAIRAGSVCKNLPNGDIEVYGCDGKLYYTIKHTETGSYRKYE